MKKHMLNVCGIIIAFCMFFFGIWQLDLIVSGPVWWYSGSVGWSHFNGAYANDYFQCFLWKTTIGRAYDTLFLIMFLSLVVLFVSLWFWND